MDLINETGLDALNFEGMDPVGELFDVVVVKVGYLLGEGGQLITLPDPVPLATEDEAFGELNEASLRWESDLAPYKPFCDVLVNATACAPKGSSRRFPVGLKLIRPERAGESPDLPPPPQGLNPWMPPSDSALAEWRQDCQRIKAQPHPAAVLIDKSLVVTGPRVLRKKWLPVRASWGLFRLGSLGLIRRNPWRLTSPGKVASLPLRYELACGGDCKVLSLDNASKRVKRKDRLPGVDSQMLRQAALSGEPDQPIAHASHPGNHLGAGFATLWYLKASKVKQLPAPQVELPGEPFTVSSFWKQAGGKKVVGMTPVGLGAICRTWTPRMERIGIPDYPETFAEDEFPGLPDDFDYRFWNCAPDDQQVPYPEGGETLELTNLCSPDHPAAVRTGGVTLLRFELPKDRPFLVVKDGAGHLGAKPLNLDTIIVEPEESQVLLTYRAVMPKTADLLWAVLKLQKADEPDQLGAVLAMMQKAEVTNA